jgi:solute carrier family 39 (zinc transporter), member 1/2/3
LEEYVPDYPLAFALTGFGVFIVLFLEQIALIFATRKQNQNKTSKSSAAKNLSNEYSLSPQVIYDSPSNRPHEEQEKHEKAHDISNNSNNDDIEHNEDCGFVNCTHDINKVATITSHGLDHHPHHTIHPSPPSSSSSTNNHMQVTRSSQQPPQSLSVSQSVSPPIDEETMALEGVLKADSLQDMILAYTLEISTAVHSIIIGVNLGLLGQNEYATITELLIALCFHQFVEGLGLGNVLDLNRQSLGSRKILLFVFIFSCTVSIGVIIGILTSSESDSASNNIAKAVATAVASGSLLYTSLAEMTVKCFHHEQFIDQPWMKLAMLLAYAAGIAMMAVIGVWA